MGDASTEVGRSDYALFEYLAACEMNYANSCVPTAHMSGKRDDIGSFLDAERHVVSVLPKRFDVAKISLPKTSASIDPGPLMTPEVRDMYENPELLRIPDERGLGSVRINGSQSEWRKLLRRLDKSRSSYSEIVQGDELAQDFLLYLSIRSLRGQFAIVEA